MFLLVAVTGCSGDLAPAVDTTVVYAGETYTINGRVQCMNKVNGKLVINAPAPPEGGEKLIRATLTEGPPLVVEAVGFRYEDVGGFADVSDEMWATKVDETYRIVGRLPAEEGATARQPFEIEVTCSRIETEIVTPIPRRRLRGGH